MTYAFRSPAMPRPLILFIALSLFSATLYAEEPDPRKMPGVKKVMDKAEAEVRKNRKAYDDANEKTFEDAEKALKEEVEKLSKAGKLEEAVAVKKFAESMGKEVLANAEKKMKPPHPGKAGAVAWNGHKYKVFKDKGSWHEAKKRCEEMGGHLVIINDEKEQAFVVELLGRNGIAVNNTESDWIGVCIGATNRTPDGRWAWVDGSPVTYSKWHRTNPNGGPGVHHALVAIHFGGQWDDYNGDIAMPAYICEWGE